MAKDIDELDVRRHWTQAPGDLTPANLDDWYRGPTLNMLPSKPAMAREGLAGILRGWVPEQPIIGPQTRVIGVGSCFASYFLLWLAENGFNRTLEVSPHNALIRYGASFENPAVIAQQLRWAFDGLDASRLTWIGKDKEVFEATEERRRLVRETLERTDVLVLTLGLSEVWYDTETGEPLWRALTKRHYDPSRHVFRVESLADTKRSLEVIEALRERYLPRMKIVFTVSPVRLKATFRPISALSANSVSKAILRASLDEFLRERPAKLNRSLFYFPSYEIVQDHFRDAFEEDNRHVTPFVAAQVVKCFADNYCEAAALAPRAAPAGASASEHHDRFLAIAADGALDAASEQGARIAELEKRVEELQGVCDERLAVIRELDASARERLALVETLHAECERLRKAREGTP
ncbi:MAG TPA: GSCFA domain-containing protein [Usitatibacter sp.]|nr:GSCFA domain-containing protein [Usitatibacter sp.]